MVNTIGFKSAKISKKDKELFVKLFREWENNFYQKAIGLSVLNIPFNQNYDLDLLGFSKSFLILFRRTGIEEYYDISVQLRRVAHAVHRHKVKQDMKLSDDRFLMLVK